MRDMYKNIKQSITANPVKTLIIAAVVVIAVLLLKSVLFPSVKHQNNSEHSAVQKWTCSMHPQIILDKPGRCPLCGMDLIPLETTVSGSELPELTISEESAKLMELETSVAERKFVEAEIRMVGKIDFDETRVKNIAAWMPGRIDRLYVDYTGVKVNKNDHLVYLYSPQLISAQAELLGAVRAAGNINAETSELIKSSTRSVLAAAREKLSLLGITDEQIKQIEASGNPVDHITIYSPIGGVVIKKNATEGMYVDTGMSIYTVADLSRLWAKLDAYESDLAWIHYGQKVEFTTQAYGGEVFKGTISFIDPVLDPATRTVKVRVNIDNSDGRLRPEMFIRAVVYSKIAKGGRVMEPNLAGKWICPMHPEIIKDAAGKCDICGMDISKTETLGYSSVDENLQAPVVIPASAALITGTRAIVYVEDPNAEKPTYLGRQIVLGQRAGDYYIVISGLADGEKVVTKGNFKIDAALQIEARPSMMNPEVQKTSAEHAGHSH